MLIRIAAVLAVLVLSAGSAFAHCDYHKQTASSDQTAAQGGGKKVPQQSGAGSAGQQG